MDSLDQTPGTLETDAIVVRTMRDGDLDAIVRIDASTVGMHRRPYYELKLKRALEETGVQLSLVAELDGVTVGFLMASVYYGEYGVLEPTATLDTIGVHSDHRGQLVGRALLGQLVTNLRGLRIERLVTQVEWNQFDLLRFFQAEGFSMAPRLSLERRLET